MEERDVAIDLLKNLGIWDYTEEVLMEKDIYRVSQALAAARADERRRAIKLLNELALTSAKGSFTNGIVYAKKMLEAQEYE